MFFDSALFGWFFLLVFAVYWGLRRTEAPRLWWLLVCSYFFYGVWNWKMLGLIAFSTTMDWLVARRIEANSEPRVRRGWLLVSLVTNLGILAYFKYANFFLASLQSLAEATGSEVVLPVLQIVLPAGISFFTFQSLSYTIDVYRGSLASEPSFVRFATFISFFPQLVAGPIVRASDLLPQLRLPAKWDARTHGLGLALIAMGLFKKVAIANPLALNLVDRVFDAPELYSSVETLAAVYGYAIQIYCDFSGYTDVAIGAALLLGFTLTPNFNRPYQSANLQEFWHRWHISLSSWLRDYLYIPLGGNRGGGWGTYRNLFITMLLGGLWHGASWNFVIWGALHGAALGVTRLFQRSSLGTAVAKRTWTRPLAVFLTFHFVCFAWIFFRAPAFEDATEILENIAAGTTFIPNLTPLLLGTIGGALAWHLSPIRWRDRGVDLFCRIPAPAQALLLVAVAVALWRIKGTDSVPFIYFQF
jgi:D-alanyl-lipoteichoic acid acyltransferase DltB (MBOAT superfamily)